MHLTNNTYIPSQHEPAMEAYINRDLSWLSFNHRVLQEAADSRVPLYERVKFLAIYSSNLDEFFRVRVARLRRFRRLKKATRREMAIKPKRELREIHRIVNQQQQLFGKIYRKDILPALRDQGILILPAEDFNPAQRAFARQFGSEHLLASLEARYLLPGEKPPFLENRGLYFVVKFTRKEELGLMEIPSGDYPRFHMLPAPEGSFHIAFLDDILRWNLDQLFGQEVENAYAIKLSRDADLLIEDEYDGDLLAKIEHGLANRNIGAPSRLLYDGRMPVPMLNRLRELYQLEEDDLVRGARYHNFNDLLDLPDPLGDASLHDPPLPPLPHPELEAGSTLTTLVRERDRLLHFPYQDYGYVPRWIREAADDPNVLSIKITLYRVANGSEVIQALLHACKRGKKVMAFVEAKARFDESSNLDYGARLEAAGAQVFYSYPAVKVHAKLLLIQREEKKTLRFYAYVGTGNFNEKTARLYADHALLTADERISGDVERVFSLLERRVILPGCRHLLVAPFSLRRQCVSLIDREIGAARAGKPASMLLKMNSLEDPDMIEKLYEASRAGVRIRLIVRGICCLQPGLPGQSENIEAISIVDRFLEHARLYLFGNGGQEVMYLASSDWMTRNLDRRVEVAAPIYDRQVFQTLRDMLELQWSDNVKARRLLPDQSNPHRRRASEEPEIRAQTAWYRRLQAQLEPSAHLASKSAE